MSIDTSPSREEKGEVQVSAQHIDHVTTNEKLHALRIDSDGEDHEHEPPVSSDKASYEALLTLPRCRSDEP